jgi:hypothetical protein
MVCWRSLMRAKACPRIRRVTKNSLSDVRDEPSHVEAVVKELRKL